MEKFLNAVRIFPFDKIIIINIFLAEMLIYFLCESINVIRNIFKFNEPFMITFVSVF